MVEARVTFDYEPLLEDELALHIGDIIKNVDCQDGGWWEGEINGKRGLFPENFVEIIKKEEISAKVLKRVRVTFNYEADQDDELTLELDDLIDVLELEEEGWCKGRLRGKIGMFPTNFVEDIKEENSHKIEAPIPEVAELPKGGKRPISTMGFGVKTEDLSNFKFKKPNRVSEDGKEAVKSADELKKPIQKVAPTESTAIPAKPLLSSATEKKSDAAAASSPMPGGKPSESMKLIEKARVAFDYEPEQDDELRLVVGDIIIITNKNVFDGWLEGELNGRRGIFPDNFVELLPPENVKVDSSSLDVVRPIMHQHSIKRAAKQDPSHVTSGLVQDPTSFTSKLPAVEKQKSTPQDLPAVTVAELSTNDKTDGRKLAQRPPPPPDTKKPMLGSKGPAPPPPATTSKPKPIVPIPPKPGKTQAPSVPKIPAGVVASSDNVRTSSTSIGSRTLSTSSAPPPIKAMLPRASSVSKQDRSPPQQDVPAENVFRAADENQSLFDAVATAGDRKQSIDLNAVKPTEQLKHVQRVKAPSKNLPSKYAEKKTKEGTGVDVIDAAQNDQDESAEAIPDSKLSPQDPNSAKAVPSAELEQLRYRLRELEGKLFKLEGVEAKMDEMEKRFKKLLMQVTNDLDAEKKNRLGQQVEIDRLRNQIELLKL